MATFRLPMRLQRLSRTLRWMSLPAIGLLASCALHNPGDSSAPNADANTSAGQTVQLSKTLNIPAHCIKPGDSDLSNIEPDDGYFRVKTRWEQLACRYADAHPRNLLVFLDGTANNKKSSTNIWRMYDLALKAADQGMPVIPYYDQGVGNDTLSKVSGNVFGSGVSLNIRQAYRFLAQAYRPDRLTVRPVEVEAIGVFDTVPAAGLLRDEEPDDHRLGLYARRGYHAMSLDEQRDDFRLQRFFAPLQSGQTLQEVWFAGVHADVGGGYGSPLLSLCKPLEDTPDTEQPIGLEATPLRWMLGNFAKDQLFATAPWPPECVSGRLHDEFLDSTGLRKRVFRLSGLIKRHPVSGDQVQGSVLCRMDTLIAPGICHELREPDGHYVPANLGSHPQRLFEVVAYACP